MEAKLCLCLMLIILGTLTVQGAIPRNTKKNPLQVFARLPDCMRDAGGYCTNLIPCIEPGYYLCHEYQCPNPQFLSCCCPPPPNRK